MQTETIDTTTRLFDRDNLKNIDKWIEGQYGRAKAGEPRNLDKYKTAADELLLRADAILKLEAGIKKNSIPELPEWHQELYKPKKVEKPKQTHNKLVAVAPTTGQVKSMIVEEIKKMKLDIIAAIQSAKVAR